MGARRSEPADGARPRRAACEVPERRVNSRAARLKRGILLAQVAEHELAVRRRRQPPSQPGFGGRGGRPRRGDSSLSERAFEVLREAGDRALRAAHRLDAGLGDAEASSRDAATFGDGGSTCHSRKPFSCRRASVPYRAPTRDAAPGAVGQLLADADGVRLLAQLQVASSSRCSSSPSGSGALIGMFPVVGPAVSGIKTSTRLETSTGVAQVCN